MSRPSRQMNTNKLTEETEAPIFSAIEGVLIKKRQFNSRAFLKPDGHLSQEAPLCVYLRYDVLLQLSVYGIAPDFRVYSVPASNHSMPLSRSADSRSPCFGRHFGGILRAG